MKKSEFTKRISGLIRDFVENDLCEDITHTEIIRHPGNYEIKVIIKSAGGNVEIKWSFGQERMNKL
jgi:hypothetical protein